MLDIDGVMVPGASWKVPELLNDGFPDFSLKAVTSLRRILSETGASIVLTTSHKSTYSIPEWRAIFDKRGIKTPIKKLNANPHFLNRKDEVLRWIETTKTNENFIIIDDDKSLNDLPHNIKQKLILTSSLIGLNESLAEDAINMLRQHSEPALA